MLLTHRMPGFASATTQDISGRMKTDGFDTARHLTISRQNSGLACRTLIQNPA